MKRRTFLQNTSALGLATLITPFGIFHHRGNPLPADTIEDGFKTPPQSAKPHTWWHWMNGNVTKEGITLDLESMARVGIGGFQNFDAGTGIPKGPVEYLGPQWLELKKHAINEAQRLGLEFTMHNCPGWSSSGGPWITPELAMQEVTWSELVLEGGKAATVNLPQPLRRLNYYQDIAVIAVPALPGEKSLSSIVKTVKTNNSAVDVKAATGETPGSITIERDGYLQFEFTQPVDIQQVSFITATQNDQRGPILLQSSNDGATFETVATFNDPRGEVSFSQNIPVTKFKFLRLSCNHNRQFSQIRFSNTPRVSDWQKRGNFAFNREGVATVVDGSAVPSAGIVHLTTSYKPGSPTTINLPKGDWTIIRFGFTPIGTMNRSAPDTGVGLECDKFSATAIEFHFNKMMEQLLPALKSITSNGKAGLLIDSYEVGMQNWTTGFEKTFSDKNSYELFKFLPCLTGRIVDSTDTTDRFLWDYRRTQGDLMANNYYGKFTELCHKNSLISYCQPYDRGPMEEMQIGARVDTNVGEFWNGLSAIFQNNITMRRTVKLSASIAHTNGQKVVAAESFTGEPGSAKWQEHPFALKALGDRMFTQGLNRIVFHRFAHQPHPTAKPGMTMGPWGSHFDRTNTWWEQGKAWMQYLSRCQYLLQEGRFVADLAYFTGEDAGVYTRVERDQLVPPPPEGYDYDLINAETILSRAKVVNKKLTLPDGTDYSILVLQDFPRMTLKLLKKIEQLVNEGLVVVGAKPTGQHGMNATGDEFSAIVSRLWPGTVIWNKPIEEVLKGINLAPDFYFTSNVTHAPLTYIHRKIDKADVYFVANQRRSIELIVCDFRVGNKAAEFWDPVTGSTSPINSAWTTATSTRVQFCLPECGSAFIVLRNPAATTQGKPQPHLDDVRQPATHPQNNFTLSFWAKPETDVMLSTNNFMDGQEPWTDNYAIYPSPGEKLYGLGHASCGIAVGRNGVAVWEHSKERPVFVFSAKKNISGWTHIAVRYDDGTPSIFINDEFIQKGPKSNFIIHMDDGNGYLTEGASFYNGDISQAGGWPNPLQGNALKAYKEHVANKPKRDRVTLTNVGSQSVFFASDGPGGPETGREIELAGKWTVAFPKQHGAPDNVTLDTLIPLNEHTESGVKYFSGTCTYATTFSFPGAKTKEKNVRQYLDLGVVEVIAEVILNGKNLGTLWTRPFMLDVTDVLVKGKNELVVQVTNLWVNRLIGDEQVDAPYKYSPSGGAGFAALSSGGIAELPEWYRTNKPKPEDGRVAFTTWKHYQKDSPLLQSGLIGPVFLRPGTTS